ncbi:GntR family transcriptional regulator [Streptomyces sp. L2]|uniref:FadR/GntR family transcriptional regulator n=1 Tax=Streptomyces sp. L2 TaxID=2162665 RepID=UPI0019D6CBFC|nr:GntR family transcriptional regulator [Streptomyces sp. L2]
MGESLEREEGADWAGGAILRPVRNGNTFDETVQRILQAIKLGVFKYGDRLPVERELAARLKVSRVTLREALRTLQQAGCVESRRGRYGGNFVTYRAAASDTGDVRRVARDMGPDLADALMFRRILEAGAAQEAARRSLTAAQRATLQERLSEVGHAPRVAYQQCDSRLHLAIAELTGSHSLATGVAETRMRLNDVLCAMPMPDEHVETEAEQHRAIVHAILVGDAEAARRTAEEHVEHAEARLRELLA